MTTLKWVAPHQVRVSLGGPGHLFAIYDDEHALLVEVGDDGQITYGDGYEPDAAAEQFWRALSDAGMVAWAAAMRAR